MSRTLENRIRRVAERRAYVVKKSGRRDRLAKDYNRFWLFDGNREFVFLPGAREDGSVTLDQLAAWFDGQTAAIETISVGSETMAE